MILAVSSLLRHVDCMQAGKNDHVFIRKVRDRAHATASTQANAVRGGIKLGMYCNGYLVFTFIE